VSAHAALTSAPAVVDDLQQQTRLRFDAINALLHVPVGDAASN
jgi:hypothetical protein